MDLEQERQVKITWMINLGFFLFISYSCYSRIYIYFVNIRDWFSIFIQNHIIHQHRNLFVVTDFGTTLRKIMAMDLDPYLDKFEIISVGACKELQLVQNLQSMWAEWSGITLQTNQWKETNIQILSGLDDIQALLDDHLVKTMTMRGSAFVKPFEVEVKDWYVHKFYFILISIHFSFAVIILRVNISIMRH